MCTVHDSLHRWYSLQIWKGKYEDIFRLYFLISHLFFDIFSSDKLNCFCILINKLCISFMANLTQINYIAPCNIHSCRRCNKCLRKIYFVYFCLLCIVSNMLTFSLYQCLSKLHAKWIADNNKIIELDADHICMHFVESPARSMLYRLSVVFNFGIIFTAVAEDLLNSWTRDPEIDSRLRERRVRIVPLQQRLEFIRWIIILHWVQCTFHDLDRRSLVSNEQKYIGVRECVQQTKAVCRTMASVANT